MTEFLVGLFALVAGVAVGVAAVAWRRPVAEAVVPEPSAERLAALLQAQSAEIRRLADGQSAQTGGADRLGQSVERALRAVGELRVRDEQRQVVEAENLEVVRRLAGVLAGGSSKGRAGENVLQDYFADLPPDMLFNDFRVNGKVVEYGLRLPDGRCLPVDSKWSAAAELQALDGCDDAAERARLVAVIEREVARRAKEVSQYLDPSITAPVAVAAIPDPAYEVLRKAHTEAYRAGVIIVPYSMALPVLLFLFSLVSRFGRAGDAQACLVEIDGALSAMESVLENKIARAGTMLQNGNDELRAGIGKARGSIARAGLDATTEHHPESSEGLLQAVQ